MLRLEELQQLKINPAVAREAYEQSSMLLKDTLETKESLEQRATTLFGGFVTVALALFGVSGALVSKTDNGAAVWPYFGAGICLAAGAACFILALKTSLYGLLLMPE